MTNAQRIFFFKVARKAYSTSGHGDFNNWRRLEMLQALPGCTSTKHVSGEEFDTLMLHFSILAQDFDLVSKFAVARETRIRFVLSGIAADLAWLSQRGVSDAYMEAIYHQTGHPSYTTIDDIPEESLLLILRIADSHVRKLRKRAGIAPSELPSAGPPWRIR